MMSKANPPAEPELDAERQTAAASALRQAEEILLGANRSQAAAALNVAILTWTLAGMSGPAPTLPGCKEPLLRLVTPDDPATGLADVPSPAVVFVVDHDTNVRTALRRLLEASGLQVETYADGQAFLAHYHRQANSCLLADTELSDLGGLALLLNLEAAADPMPVIMITGSSDIGQAVRAMKAGAVDFIEKPIGGEQLIASVLGALEGQRTATGRETERSDAVLHFKALTPRQRQIMMLVLAGHPSKNIAADLGISQRTVENHRAAIMRKSGSRSLPALMRLALAAEGASGPN